jgi:hypothetical protein
MQRYVDAFNVVAPPMFNEIHENAIAVMDKLSVSELF